MTKKSKKDINELAKPTGHVTETDLVFRPDDVAKREAALNQLTQEAEANGEYDTEPTVRIDGEAVITVANLQKLINSLVFKLLSSN